MPNNCTGLEVDIVTAARLIPRIEMTRAQTKSGERQVFIGQTACAHRAA